VPLYEYRCEANGQLVEVRHKMDERLLTWGELCERAGMSTGRTDPQAPIEKLMSAGFISGGTSTDSGPGTCEAPACGSGMCGGGFCGGDDF
jgi:predicted nucleic acid-binding Zn ribbon protein